MKLKLVVVLLGVTFATVSCNRYLTPAEAANGKAKCGRMVR